MKKLLWTICLFLGLTTSAWATIYTGSLTSAIGGGMFATGDWGSGGASLSWQVWSPEDTANASLGYWRYAYAWNGNFDNVGGGNALSHIDIQVSDNFTAENIKFGTTTYTWTDKNGTHTAPVLGSHDGPGNPGIPAPLYGLKWDTPDALTFDYTTFSFTIVTDRAPMWGDFYAKDGKYDLDNEDADDKDDHEDDKGNHEGDKGGDQGKKGDDKDDDKGGDQGKKGDDKGDDKDDDEGKKGDDEGKKGDDKDGDKDDKYGDKGDKDGDEGDKDDDESDDEEVSNGGKADVIAYNTGFGVMEILLPVIGDGNTFATTGYGFVLVPDTLSNGGGGGVGSQGDPAPVPEPATVVLLGSGLLGLLYMGRRKRKT